MPAESAERTGTSHRSVVRSGIRRHRRSGVRAAAPSRARARESSTRAARRGFCAMPTLRTRRRGSAGRTKPRMQRLETLAKRKGWRLPAENPASRDRRFAPRARHAPRANFIVQPDCLSRGDDRAVPRAADGKGDAELKRALREALPGYQENLDLLLASESLRMLSDSAAFAASPYATHDGVFQRRTARRPTAGWLAMRDACLPCTEQPSPHFMRAFPMACRIGSLARRWYYTPAIASRVQRAADLPGRPAPAGGVCAGAHAVHAAIASSRPCASLPTCCSTA